MDVVTLEEHSSALPEFWGLPAGDKTLVCLDAHLDLQPVNPARLAALRGCVSKAEVKALEKPHHLLPDRGYAYSLEDWLHPAHRLGLFQHLVWVAPPHVSVGFSTEVFAHLEQMDGVLPSELASFCELPAGGFRGTLAGVPITICNYKQLGALGLSGRVLLDIDTDYFIEVPGDRAWVDPGEVFAALHAFFPAPELVTLSRSATSGFLPLRNRYFADYLAALWEGRGPDADHYRRLFSLDASGGDASALADALAQESARFPDCAATWTLRSLVCTGSEDSNAYRQRASSLDERYRLGVLTRACAYPQRRMPVGAEDCRELLRLLAEEPQTPRQLACAQAAVGQVMCAVGQVNAAIDLYAQCSAHFGSHPGLALEIGKALLARGQVADATGFLKAALDDDLSRTSARVYLAEMYSRSAKPQLALDCAAAAHEAAPAWSAVTLLLAELHRQLGHAKSAAALGARQREQAQQVASLVRAHARRGGWPAG